MASPELIKLFFSVSSVCNRSRVEGNKRTELRSAADILLRCFVDPAEARNDILGCFGRSHEWH